MTTLALIILALLALGPGDWLGVALILLLFVTCAAAATLALRTGIIGNRES